MNPFGKYLRVFQLGIQTSLEYRFDFAFSLVSAFFPILIQTFIWTAVFAGSPDGQFFGYSYEEMILYTIVAAIVTRIVSSNTDHSIGTDIKDGALNKHLILPASYFGLKLFGLLGQKMFFFAVMHGIIFILLIVFANLYGVDLTIERVALFVAAVTLALLLSFLISYTVAAIAFWLAEISYFFELTGLLIIILSGGIFPIEVFGETINELLDYLPFKYSIYFPTNVINGKLNGHEIAQGLGLQGLWIGVLFAGSRMIWSVGMKKYLGLGG
ncbi:hypothetical protein BBD42_24930 [Paenibacillus sp. BIHB 4019]|uniref:ABC transporter permease n=1 Tax=Paenibacillus sp. BIHB 4019 TaxID=1870819 RepID=A0A1B2DNS3_9BACL|nr:ABC-2 family transporter protein [Paenibacillus sp. BIHB 4019]ANY69365.1 hypothetical protein BBD42_24930 [Paenibacillus sp. BIHB 4019]